MLACCTLATGDDVTEGENIGVVAAASEGAAGDISAAAGAGPCMGMAMAEEEEAPRAVANVEARAAIATGTGAGAGGAAIVPPTIGLISRTSLSIELEKAAPSVKTEPQNEYHMRVPSSIPSHPSAS